jgi:predicted dehydrogenase
MKIAIIGCGNISSTYLQNAKLFKAFEVAYVADLDLARAQAKAQEFGVKALSVDDALTSDAGLILNLTIPAAHASLAMRALEAGKHVYNEKPLAIELEDSAQMLALAEQKGLRIGCAPDTFMGAALQTTRAFLDEGGLGTVAGVSAHMLGRGPDQWHPDPAFFFQHGAGPLFDMGPYYLTAFVHLFGAIKRVTAFARTTRTERQVMQGPKAGQTFKVETPTHISAVLECESGAVAHLTVSFDVVSASNTNIEIYGSDGALVINDPNMFSAPLRFHDGNGEYGQGTWTNLENTRPYFENSRGVGVADLIRGVENNRPHRASGALAHHVLEVMHSILKASQTATVITLSSRVDRPELLPLGENL